MAPMPSEIFDDLSMPGEGEGGGRGATARRAKRRKKSRARSRRRRQGYRVGDVVNLNQLLFHHERDFLIKYNNDMVWAEQLEGKVVVLYFVSVQHIYLWVWKHTQYIVDVYTELVSLSRPFEVIFIAVTDEHDNNPMISEKNFEDLFSIMPWTAIPFSDSEARTLVEKSFLGSKSGTYTDVAFVISETGVVSQENALLPLRSLGAAGYPFSKASVQCLKSEDKEASTSPSLKNLLVSTERDYVINNKGDKVSICDLEDKVVALFLYEEGWTNKLTKTLKDAYKHWVQDKKVKFEVVLVYVSDSFHTCGCTNAESFQKVFETMPWLAIPYNDRSSCKKLMRVFRYPFELENEEFAEMGYGSISKPDPSLVIIGPHGEFFEPWGSRILMKFGINAYPWTSDKVCMLQVEKVKQINLNMLWGQETVFIRECESEEVQFSDINVGKRIVVFCDCTRQREVFYDNFRMKLHEKYLESKGNDDEFEVIHLDVSNITIGSFQWLSLHPDHDYHNKLMAAQQVFCDYLHYVYGILVFDVDGKIVRATSQPTFENIGFPFHSGSVEEEVVEDIKWLYKLDRKIYDLH